MLVGSPLTEQQALDLVVEVIKTDSGLSVSESGPGGGPEASVYAIIGTFGGGPLVNVRVEAAARLSAALIVTIERTDSRQIMPTALPVPSQLDAVMAESHAIGNAAGGERVTGIEPAWPAWKADFP